MIDQNPTVSLALSLQDINNLIAVIEGYMEHAPKRSLEENHYLSGLGLRIRAMTTETLNALQSEKAIQQEEVKPKPAPIVMTRNQRRASKNKENGNHATKANAN